jgi:hypothetical protein
MKPLLTALLCSLFFNCIAQKNNDSLFFATMKSRKISLPEKSSSDTIYNLPFHSVEIIDARPDTTSIGFLKTGNTTNRLIFENNFSAVYTKYIYQHYNVTNDSNDLLILIKEFRVTKYIQTNGMSNENVIQWNGGCVISSELFLRNNNSYRALYKIDSLLIESSKNERLTDLIAEAFETILKKSENKNLSEMHIGKSEFMLTDIQKHAGSFLDYPILSATVFNKGVYRNFDEFKLNNPSIKNFEIMKGHLTDELFITDNDQSYPLQNFWGYSDGKNLFIRSADNLFKLIKTGNAFNIKGIKSLMRPYTSDEMRALGAATNSLGGVALRSLINNNLTADITAFQLNMQNGEIY